MAYRKWKESYDEINIVNPEKKDIKHDIEEYNIEEHLTSSISI